ncbi:hypothetical protein [Elioraea rosea]|uniref:hypothetical protein n=1 Tax=Elioraea rosea TaxID=2492390 RepID=UPI0011857EF5|nr:hypothetical protein [Elioraea rosea]
MTMKTPVPKPAAPGGGMPKPTKREEKLDHALDESFPASDPPTMTDPTRRAGEPAGAGSPSPGKGAEKGTPLEKPQQRGDRKPGAYEEPDPTAPLVAGPEAREAIRKEHSKSRG